MSLLHVGTDIATFQLPRNTAAFSPTIVLIINGFVLNEQPEYLQ